MKMKGFSSIAVTALLLSVALTVNARNPDPFQVRISKEKPLQGEIFEITVESGREIEESWLEFAGQKVYFVSSGTIARGLFGFDLAEPPGVKKVWVFLRNKDGTSRMELKVVLSKGKFAVEKIDGVDDSYVNPGKAAMDRIRSESYRLSSIWKSSRGKALWDKGFVLPIEGFKGKGFGKRRLINGQPRSPHTGLDMSSPEGTPVHSISGGTVKLAGDLYFSGNSVIIDHGGGFFSMYFHLKDITVNEGIPVKKGELIGHVGSTGRATGPHLHFGVRFVNERVNPEGLYKYNEHAKIERSSRYGRRKK